MNNITLSKGTLFKLKGNDEVYHLVALSTHGKYIVYMKTEDHQKYGYQGNLYKYNSSAKIDTIVSLK